MQVNEIMNTDVCYGSPLTNAAAAAELMWKKNVGSLPVVGDGGKVIGIVTDRDLFIALGTQNRLPAELTLGEIVNREPMVCAPGDDVKKALKSMAKAHVHRLPVVEQGVLKGVLSIDDVVRKTDSALKDDIVQTLRALSESQTAGRA